MSAAPPALRLFESYWAPLTHNMNGFLGWLVESIAKALNWEPVTAKLMKVTHADDMNRQAAKLQLMMGRQISQTTGLASRSAWTSRTSRRRCSRRRSSSRTRPRRCRRRCSRRRPCSRPSRVPPRVVPLPVVIPAAAGGALRRAVVRRRRRAGQWCGTRGRGDGRRQRAQHPDHAPGADAEGRDDRRPDAESARQPAAERIDRAQEDRSHAARARQVARWKTRSRRPSSREDNRYWPSSTASRAPRRPCPYRRG